MKRFNFITNIVLLILVGIGTTSCEDFLTLYPQDRIVEEKFWEDKNDLEGVRNEVYRNMASTIEKLIIWGDIRSDAYVINPSYNSQQGNNQTYTKIVEAQLDTTMTQYDWGSVYTTINYCNKILNKGAEVLARDAQFTATEWQQMRAEITAMRALNYFYLLRAFKDIPFTMQVINSDEEVQNFVATNQLAVLDYLISDVTAVAGLGKNRFSQTVESRGYMTNTAIYALLADMYLWRSALREGRGFPEEEFKADAQKVIEFGQKSLDALALQNQQINNSSFDRSTRKTDDFGSGLPNAPLIKNEDMQNDYNAKLSVTINSYSSIFISGNSDESMFELQFLESDQRKNGVVGSLWGNSAGTHFAASKDALTNALGDKYDSDSRIWYSCQNQVNNETSDLTGYYMFKWSNCRFNFGNQEGKFKTTYSSDDYHNWIIYRMTDVMLMMAEAHAVLGNYAECRNIVDAIHKRSMLDQSTGLSVATSDKTKDKCIDLVMKERLIELIGEGKRWFDLVRYAERKGGGHNPDPREPQYMDGSDGVNAMVSTFLAKTYTSMEAPLKNRIKNRYGLYSPIYYMEIRANNGLMQQNPVWNREKAL